MLTLVTSSSARRRKEARFLAAMFPLIADAIDRVHARTGEIVLHDEIIAELLMIPEAAARLETRAASDPARKSIVWFADNAVAWFSQWITVGRSREYGQRFARERRLGKWAYVPVRPVDLDEETQGDPHLVLIAGRALPSSTL